MACGAKYREVLLLAGTNAGTTTTEDADADAADTDTDTDTGTDTDTVASLAGGGTLYALEETARTGCGYGIVKGVSSSPNAELSVTNEMPSFCFLSETLKYLYLTFDENNPINSDKERNWIFTMEAHPVFMPHSSKTAGNIGSQDEKWLDDARSNLLKSVDNLIASNNTASLTMRVPAKNKGGQNNTNRRLHRETWALSLKTGKFPHMKDLQNLSSMRSFLKDTANCQKPL